MKVIILRGIPGSGKSTWIKHNLSGFSVCSADFFFEQDGKYVFRGNKLGEAHKSCLRNFLTYLEEGRNTAVDNTNLGIEEIAPYYALAELYGAEVEIRTLVAPLDKCIARNIHKVPASLVTQMENKRLENEKQFPRRWNNIIMKS